MRTTAAFVSLIAAIGQVVCLAAKTVGSCRVFYTTLTAWMNLQVLIEAPAGSAIFFDPYIVHGSGANLSDLPRRAIIITYQPALFTALKSGRVREDSMRA